MRPFGFLDDYEPVLFVITWIINGVTALIINLLVALWNLQRLAKHRRHLLP
ncbi:hypothetical protein ACNKHW_09390 [Shigella flexneri]